jgi:hypothetical protein
LQRDEYIPAASHDDFDTFLSEQLLHPPSGIQRQMFLINVANGGSTVMVTVTSIKNHGIKSRSKRN